MTEQIKHEADVFAEKLIKQKMANHDVFVKEEVKKEIVSVYTAGAKKATKMCNEYYQNELDEVYKDYAKRLEAQKETIASYDADLNKAKKQIEKMKCCINDLVHLGEFNENTDEEYLNYQVHEALKNAEQFIKE